MDVSALVVTACLSCEQVCYALNNEWKGAQNPDDEDADDEDADEGGEGSGRCEGLGASFVSHLLSVAFVNSAPQVYYLICYLRLFGGF